MTNAKVEIHLSELIMLASMILTLLKFYVQILFCLLNSTGLGICTVASSLEIINLQLAT